MNQRWTLLQQPHSSHASRGNPSGNALRSVTQERHWLHSHAGRGNDIRLGKCYDRN